MKVGELFVNLGIKGAEKTAAALGSARDGLKNLTSTSLEAKAALVGAFYALEKLTVGTNNQGTALKQFADRTGLSTDMLQRWQYLMRQNKVSAEETMQSIEGLQDAIAAYASGRGPAPAGLTAIANVLGPKFDILKARDTGTLLNYLREYAQKTAHGEIPEDIRNQVFKGFGLTPNFVATLSTSKVNLDKIRPSEIFSEREVKALHAMNVGWANLGNTIDKAFGRLNIQFGPRFLKDMQMLIPQLLQLATAFGKFAEAVHLMEGVGKVFQGWTQIFKGLTDAVNQATDKGILSLLPSKESVKFLAKDLLNQGQAAVSAGARSVINTFNTTINANVEGATELGNEVGKQIQREIQIAVRSLPNSGAAGGF